MSDSNGHVTSSAIRKGAENILRGGCLFVWGVETNLSHSRGLQTIFSNSMGGTHQIKKILVGVDISFKIIGGSVSKNTRY